MAASPLLFELATEDVRVEFFGPTKPPNGILAVGPDPEGTLHVELPPDATLVSCQWRRVNGVLSAGDGQIGPRLYEGVQYDLVVESLQGLPVGLVHRDPRLISGVTSPGHHPELALGRVNFLRQLGYSRFEVAVEQETCLAFTVEVFPTKLDYEDDYQQLLADVTSVSRALALEYLRATYRGAEASAQTVPTDVDFAVLLRQQIDELDRAMRYIGEHPQRRLIREIVHVRTHRVRRPSRLTSAAIRQGRGRGPWMSLPGIGKVRSELPVVAAQETLDTAEHRWLKQALTEVRRRLAPLVVDVAREIQLAEGRGWSTQRLDAELAELEAAENRIARSLRSEVMSAARGVVPAGFSSLGLIGQPGYREAFRAMLTLRLGLMLDGESLETSVKDLDQVYEMWCFVRVVALVHELTGGPEIDLRDLFELSRHGLRMRLTEGQRVEMTSKTGAAIGVSYNRSFAGLTGSQRPDILVEITRPSWPSMILVFDAKYRLDASDRYIRQFGVAGPPEDALNQLHRYRDAITVGQGTAKEGRPVVRGAALFPGGHLHDGKFPASPLYRALSALGIGALPFLPSDESFVRAWLREMLALPSGDLANPGPNFLGAAERARRHELSRSRVLLEEKPAHEVSAALNSNELSVVLSHAAAQSADKVGLVVREPQENQTRLVAISKISRREIFAGGATPMTRLELEGWHTSEARAWTGSGVTYPLITSELALRLANYEQDLALRAYAEWELYEALLGRGLAVKPVLDVPQPAVPQATLEIGLPTPVARVRYRRAAGFEVIPAGQQAILFARTVDVLEQADSWE